MKETQTLASTPEGTKTVADLLYHGEVVAIPTETVYGLAADPFNAEAVKKVFEAKDRPADDPLILHVNARTLEDLEGARFIDLEALNSTQKETYAQLIEEFWPGPLTLIFPKHSRISDEITAGLDTVGVRAPALKITQGLIEMFGPVVAPSANRFAGISPTDSAAVLAELGGRISAVLDGGKCERGMESTVLRVTTNGELHVLRPGAITLEELKEAIGTSPRRAEGGSASPGQHHKHYSPKTPLYRMHEVPESSEKRRAGVLCFGKLSSDRKTALESQHNIDLVTICSLSRELSDASKEFYASLRRLDSHGLDLIIAEDVPVRAGMGLTLGDRLDRAAQKAN